MTEGRGQRAEGRGRRTEGRGQRTAVFAKATPCQGGQRTEDRIAGRLNNSFEMDGGLDNWTEVKSKKIQGCH